MINETRVNLRHLLEDIRDSYSMPLEEVILVELVANALDSKADRIDFVVNPSERFLRCIDNGRGMKRPQIREYHNIAASTKVRGEGIGFAGVGAKLSLLIADRVVTESKGGYGSRAATEWRLTNPYRAPWKFIPCSDSVPTSRGTGITLYFSDNQSHLLKQEFVRDAIIKHYYPLFHEWINREILRFVYRKSVEMTVNDDLVMLPDSHQRVDYGFRVFLGQGKKPAGAGFVRKNVLEQGWLARLTGRGAGEAPVESGLAISTYGKIIKTGWEWLGILPKSASVLSGVVEVPLCSALLTTNKNDFLSDATHLKRYYQARKAIQKAIVPVLAALGEYAPEGERRRPTADMKPLTHQIESALGEMSGEFPELLPLLGVRRALGSVKSRERAALPTDTLGKSPKEPSQAPRKAAKSDNAAAGDNIGRKKKPGLELVLEEISDSPDILGRMIGETISINTLHPAWKKALETGQEEYHMVVVVGLVLADYLAPDKHPQEFLTRFLSSWSRVELGQRKLL